MALKIQNLVILLALFTSVVSSHVVQRDSDRDLVEELCNRTSNATMCSSLIKSDPRSNSTSDNRGFLDILIDQTIPITNATNSHILHLFNATTDKVTKECLHICDELYELAIDDLQHAKGLVQFKSRDSYLFMLNAIGDFGERPVQCEETFKEPPSRPSPIADIDTYLFNLADVALEIVDIIQCNRTLCSNN
ncbi:Pectinesterase inhibitor [Corchorus olitorius]|uniref:Pectinesterase inhibitor n=1 Tax=Corchorus olitorius TaxID=93759 RepID=A0A1R3JZA2_9ROSI|nr:Pectinesterase inhibitor [Corchorus olitorius]